MPLKGKSVLVAEDEPLLLDIIAEEIELSGARVAKAINGVEAFKIYQTQNPDILISDVRMPGGDGLELTARVRENSIETLIVLVTGYSSGDLAETYNMGADAIFDKPCDYGDIAIKVGVLAEPPEVRWRRSNNVVNMAHPQFQIDARILGTMKNPKSRDFALGRRGFFVPLSVEQPRVGQRVQFHLQFPEDSDFPFLRGSGVCRWSRRATIGELAAGAGIEIVNLHNEDVERTAQLAGTLKTKASIPSRASSSSK